MKQKHQSLISGKQSLIPPPANIESTMTSVHKQAIHLARIAAAKAHRGQFRKDGTTPYIVHPERVADRVKFFGGNHIGIIVAWLHDVMEDCEGGEVIVRETLRQIELPQQEREEIFSIISALTKDDAVLGKSDRLADTLNRINQAPGQAVLVKLCDRMDNLEDGRNQGAKFLSVYLPLSDQLIETLSDRAIKNGYRNALETLKAMRRTFPDF
jgi:(p)ppGpp synthase/HD superfamily hydrolase